MFRRSSPPVGRTRLQPWVGDQKRLHGTNNGFGSVNGPVPTVPSPVVANVVRRTAFPQSSTGDRKHTGVVTAMAGIWPKKAEAPTCWNTVPPTPPRAAFLRQFLLYHKIPAPSRAASGKTSNKPTKGRCLYQGAWLRDLKNRGHLHRNLPATHQNRSPNPPTSQRHWGYRATQRGLARQPVVRFFRPVSSRKGRRVRQSGTSDGDWEMSSETA